MEIFWQKLITLGITSYMLVGSFISFKVMRYHEKIKISLFSKSFRMKKRKTFITKILIFEALFGKKGNILQK